MNRQLFLACIPALTLACALALCPLSAQAAQPAVPEQPVAVKGSKKTVMFPHASHAKIECVVCHHKVDGKENFEKCATVGCHDNLADKKGEKSLYYVMHGKSAELKHQSCLQCHAKVVETMPDLKKKLTGCKDSACHPGGQS